MFRVSMEPIDQAGESRRLEELYAEMSEGELRALLEKVDGLTTIAQQALKAEVSRRGPKMQVDDAAGDACTPVEDGLTDVWRATGLSEAHSIKEILDRAGISTCLVPNDVEGADAFTGNSGDGIEIKVMGRDYERARNAIYPYYSELHAAYPSSAPKPEEQKDYVARCPKCGCADILFQSLDAEATRGPGTDPRFNWTCDACGNRWQDEGNEEKY